MARDTSASERSAPGSAQGNRPSARRTSSVRPARASGERPERFGQVLIEVVQALVAAGVRKLPATLINRLIAGCALVALVCPLLLWISWSKAGFFILIAVAALAVAIIYVLIWAQPEDPF